MIEAEIKIIDTSAIKAFSDYAASRALKGRSLIETLRKIMKYWVSFAMARVPKGDAAKIERKLSAIITASTRNGWARGKYASRWKGTLAGALVRALYPETRKLRGAAFYRKVQSFVNRAKASAGHHRRGFQPAFRKLRAQQSTGPTLKVPAGSIVEQVSEILTSIVVENFARSKPTKFNNNPAGVGALNGEARRAFEDALPDVIKLFESFVQEDHVRKPAKAAGFSVE